MFSLRPAAPPPAPKSWQPVEATKEIYVKRHPVSPAPVANSGTAPLPCVPDPGKAAQKGWFGRLFGK